MEERRERSGYDLAEIHEEVKELEFKRRQETGRRIRENTMRRQGKPNDDPRPDYLSVASIHASADEKTRKAARARERRIKVSGEIPARRAYNAPTPAAPRSNCRNGDVCHPAALV